MTLLDIIQNKIIIINIFLWIIGIYLAVYTKKIAWVFLLYYVFILNEIIYYITGWEIYHSHWRTELFYSSDAISEIRGKQLDTLDLNFTEGYFPDDKCISSSESEKNRFDHFIEILGLRPGDVVLDAGCGWGGMVAYFREKGIEAYGITITKVQYETNVKTHGPFFKYGDYTEFNPEFVGKFDVIIFPGSLEHVYGGNIRLMSSYQYKYDKMIELFTMIKQYFKPDSTSKKLFSSNLHMNLKFKDHWQSYVIERSYGGIYLPTEKYSLVDVLKNSGYKVTMNKDYTWHYYRATECDNTHFGVPTDIGTFLTALVFLIYPHILYINMYARYGYWMWMWDGNNHYIDNHNYTFQPDMNKRPTTLFYTIAQL
jgi:cyclopropane fatty-acyl-phospholipid synthase-like methyltransferase